MICKKQIKMCDNTTVVNIPLGGRLKSNNFKVGENGITFMCGPVINQDACVIVHEHIPGKLIKATLCPGAYPDTCGVGVAGTYKVDVKCKAK
jgi:hypothetical protein